MSITNFICTSAADRTFTETLAAMGGFELLRQSLGISGSYLCRGGEGELIMRFRGCEDTNKAKAELCEIDMYTLTFYFFSFSPENLGCQVVGVVEDVAISQLQHGFEEFTGISLVPKLVPSHQRMNGRSFL